MSGISTVSADASGCSDESYQGFASEERQVRHAYACLPKGRPERCHRPSKAGDRAAELPAKVDNGRCRVERRHPPGQVEVRSTGRWYEVLRAMAEPDGQGLPLITDPDDAAGVLRRVIVRPGQCGSEAEDPGTLCMGP